MSAEIIDAQLSVAALHGDPLITRSLGGPEGLQARIDSYQNPPVINRADVHEILSGLCATQFVLGALFFSEEWISGKNLTLSLSQSAAACLALVNRKYSNSLR